MNVKTEMDARQSHSEDNTFSLWNSFYQSLTEIALEDNSYILCIKEKLYRLQNDTKELQTNYSNFMDDISKLNKDLNIKENFINQLATLAEKNNHILETIDETLDARSNITYQQVEFNPNNVFNSCLSLFNEAFKNHKLEVTTKTINSRNVLGIEKLFFHICISLAAYFYKFHYNDNIYIEMVTRVTNKKAKLNIKINFKHYKAQIKSFYRLHHENLDYHQLIILYGEEGAALFTINTFVKRLKGKFKINSEKSTANSLELEFSFEIPEYFRPTLEIKEIPLEERKTFIEIKPNEKHEETSLTGVPATLFNQTPVSIPNANEYVDGKPDPHGLANQLGQAELHGQVNLHGQINQLSKINQFGQINLHGQLNLHGQENQHGQLNHYGQANQDAHINQHVLKEPEAQFHSEPKVK